MTSGVNNVAPAFGGEMDGGGGIILMNDVVSGQWNAGVAQASSDGKLWGKFKTGIVSSNSGVELPTRFEFFLFAFFTRLRRVPDLGVWHLCVSFARSLCASNYSRWRFKNSG